jgi:hypothetical protein
VTKPSVSRLDDLRTDLAGTHRARASSGATVDEAVVASDRRALEADGTSC